MVVTSEPSQARAAHRPSVTARVLGILGAFDESHPRLTLTEIAHSAGLPVSTAHRLIAELEAWDAVERDEQGRYCVGRRLWRLGTLAPVQRELREVALPAMQDLYEVTHENVHLAVRDGITALYVERIYGTSSVSLVSRAGVPLPLHATGVGKVLFAYADRDVIDRALAQLRPITRYTIVERGRMMRELAAVRRNGYGRTAEEMTLGTCSIAVPVFGAAGSVVAALGLVTGTRRRDMTRFVPALQVAASTIGRSIQN
jgi:DNA-binding IclR family transcriptional regulator